MKKFLILPIVLLSLFVLAAPVMGQGLRDLSPAYVVHSQVLECDVTGTDYADLDLWADLITCTDVLPDTPQGSAAELQDFKLLVNNDTSTILNVGVFSRPVTMVATNTAMTGGADFMPYMLGQIPIVAADYKSFGPVTNKFVVKTNLGITCKSTWTNRNVYLVIMAGGAGKLTNQPNISVGFKRK